jgi:hypothetical protein
MLSEESEEIQTMFWHYVVFGGILLVLSVCKVGSGWFGDPIVGVALLLTWILYSLWSWKNKKALFRRCVLALPFALLTLLLLKLTFFRSSDSWPSALGILMFILLTRETKNLKGSFVISLIIGAILVSLLAVLVILINSILVGPV